MNEEKKEEQQGFRVTSIDRSNVPVSSLSGASGGTDGVPTPDPIPPGRDTVQNTVENRGKEQDPADLEFAEDADPNQAQSGTVSDHEAYNAGREAGTITEQGDDDADEE